MKSYFSKYNTVFYRYPVSCNDIVNKGDYYVNTVLIQSLSCMYWQLCLSCQTSVYMLYLCTGLSWKTDLDLNETSRLSKGQIQNTKILAQCKYTLCFLVHYI